MADHSQGSEDNGSHPPIPQPFNPVPNAVLDSQHVVHSVVPDLMRVYESLTKGNHNVSHEHEQQQQEQQQQQREHEHGREHSSQDQQSNQEQKLQAQQEVSYQYQQQQHHPTHHVNYTFIDSEEQYHQLYNGSLRGVPQQPGMPHNHYAQFHGHLQQPSSLPLIPPLLPQAQHAPAPPKAPPSDDSSTKSSRSERKRRGSNTSLVDQDPSSGGSTSGKKGSSSSKSRKKAKETDGRWSKRFTWPDELHRDFVSAVFDVGLKHSSPATIMEQMPKHPQITSERVKSHLQKYRLHRTKSKQEFMSSYEASLRKYKSGEMDNAKTQTNGEVAAHLTHQSLVGAPTPKSHQPQPQGQAAKGVPAVMPSSNSAAVAAPTHEALMLPKLTELEKSSPIGASMGYLLGLFFSLKKQLLMQRATKSGNAPAEAAGELVNGGSNADAAQNGNSTGPVAAVYNSFVDTNPLPNVAAMPHPAPVAPAIMAGGMDWSGNAGQEQHPAMPHPPSVPAPTGPPITASVPNPVVPPQNTGSTRNNLEASSMMKREMQNQMAFQNKMRALKQQELNKYKDVSPTSDGHNSRQSPDGGRHRQEHSVTFADLKDHNQDHGHHPPQTAHPEHEHQNDDQQKGGEDMGVDQGQGAGENAQARNRGHSVGSEDFWNADVMDEQLFEFLMNT